MSISNTNNSQNEQQMLNRPKSVSGSESASRKSPQISGYSSEAHNQKASLNLKGTSISEKTENQDTNAFKIPNHPIQLLPITSQNENSSSIPYDLNSIGENLSTISLPADLESASYNGCDKSPHAFDLIIPFPFLSNQTASNSPTNRSKNTSVIVQDSNSSNEINQYRLANTYQSSFSRSRRITIDSSIYFPRQSKTAYFVKNIRRRHSSVVHNDQRLKNGSETLNKPELENLAKNFIGSSVYGKSWSTRISNDDLSNTKNQAQTIGISQQILTKTLTNQEIASSNCHSIQRRFSTVSNILNGRDMADFSQKPFRSASNIGNRKGKQTMYEWPSIAKIPQNEALVTGAIEKSFSLSHLLQDWLYKISFIILVLFFFLVVLAMPIDMIVQSQETRQHWNVFIIIGACVIMAIAATVITCIRIVLTNRSLAAIPHKYTPGLADVPIELYKNIQNELQRCRDIAYKARPIYRTPPVYVSHDGLLPPSTKPWGSMLAKTLYIEVIVLAAETIVVKALMFHPSLARPPGMPLRVYMPMLHQYSVVNVPKTVVNQFVQQFELARYSGKLVTESQFSELMSICHKILVSMTPGDLGRGITSSQDISRTSSPFSTPNRFLNHNQSHTQLLNQNQLYGQTSGFGHFLQPPSSARSWANHVGDMFTFNKDGDSLTPAAVPTQSVGATRPNTPLSRVSTTGSMIYTALNADSNNGDDADAGRKILYNLSSSEEFINSVTQLAQKRSTQMASSNSVESRKSLNRLHNDSFNQRVCRTGSKIIHKDAGLLNLSATALVMASTHNELTGLYQASQLQPQPFQSLPSVRFPVNYPAVQVQNQGSSIQQLAEKEDEIYGLHQMQEQLRNFSFHTDQKSPILNNPDRQYVEETHTVIITPDTDHLKINQSISTSIDNSSQTDILQRSNHSETPQQKQTNNNSYSFRGFRTQNSTAKWSKKRHSRVSSKFQASSLITSASDSWAPRQNTLNQQQQQTQPLTDLNGTDQRFRHRLPRFLLGRQGTELRGIAKEKPSSSEIGSNTKVTGSSKLNQVFTQNNGKNRTEKTNGGQDEKTQDIASRATSSAGSVVIRR